MNYLSRWVIFKHLNFFKPSSVFNHYHHQQRLLNSGICLNFYFNHNFVHSLTVNSHKSILRNVLNIQTSRMLSNQNTSKSNNVIGHNKITSHKVMIGEQTIHYEKSGNGDHVILLMPGAIGTGKTDFLPQLTGLNGDIFTQIAWDPPGYGQSRPPERDFTDFYRQDAQQAAELMKKLNYSQYSVLGWSDGGNTAMILAANNPDVVQKLIVWGSNAYVNDEDREMLLKVRNPKTDWSEQFRNNFIKIYGEEYFYRLWDRFVSNYITMSDICKQDLPNIECPVLILHGDLDPMVSAEHPVYLVNNIPNATLYRFEKGKHNIHQRYADEFNKLVEDFLLTKG